MIMLFESFSPYYQPIKMDEWQKILKNTKKSSQLEKTTLSSLFNKKFAMFTFDKYNERIGRYHFLVIDNKIGSDLVGYKDIHYQIDKIPDEWYLVTKSSNSSYSMYKCDQFEGLIEFLKDEGVVKYP